MIFRLTIFLWFSLATFAQGADRPNFLWITSEDNGPWLGCYGDPVARTPNIDQLAAEGIRYLNCFSNAAVCAPARQTLITGILATSLGGQHMRSNVTFPEGVGFFPKTLREAGYYTSNNSKTDYNGAPANGPKDAMAEAWDESSSKAHWRKRKKGQPFFAVFNFTDSHESRLFAGRWKNRELKTDPAAVKLPAYLPDLPEIRRDLARYYDCLEDMDRKVGEILAQLEADGLTEQTIVFYFGDHGGSLPRGKSFTYDSGTRVPLIVRLPEKWPHLGKSAPGKATDRLVSFVDFAPAVLSLAGLKAPDTMQGRAFLGEHAAVPREFVHTFRGRRGERYDLVRGVRSKEFLYLRNYSPQVPVMQFNGYAWNTIPAYRAWFEAWRQGGLPPEQARWFEAPKSPEELYDVAADPDQVRNLAEDPAYTESLEKLRAENDRHLLAIRDSVFFPEGMGGREWAAYQDDERYPLAKLLDLGDTVSGATPEDLVRFREAMRSPNPCVRAWGVTGCIVLGQEAKAAEPGLVDLLTDGEPLIQIQAARALAGMEIAGPAIPVIGRYLKSGDPILKLRAILAVDECEPLAASPELKPLIEKARKGGGYAPRVAEHLLSRQSD